MTLEEHQAWQANPDALRCILVIAKAYDILGEQENTYYLSTQPYQTKPDETDENMRDIHFEPRLSGDIEITYKIPFFGETRNDSGVATLKIDNSDGIFDLAYYYAVGGRDISIYWGDPSWPFDDFALSPLLTGKMERIQIEDDSEITVFFSDYSGQLNREVQGDLIASGPSADKPAPLAYGQLLNITPVLIDPNTGGGVYKWHSGTVEEVTAVYDNGVLLTITTEYTLDNANGELTLVSRPVGTITLDGKGAKPDGAWLSKTGEIVKSILLDVFGEWAEDYIDTDALEALDTEKPYTVGIYITERENLLDILDRLFSGVGSGYYWNPVINKLSISMLINPGGESAIYEMTPLDVSNIRLSIADIPQYRTRLQYAKNWTVQDGDSLAASVTDPNFCDADRVAFLANEYREKVAENATTLTVWPNAVDPQPVETLIVDETDAGTEATARQAILGSQVLFLEVENIAAPFSILPGDIVTITDDDFGLESGRNIQVLEITKQIIDNSLTLRGWFIGAEI